MRIFVPKETHPAEKRIPMLPGGAAKLVKLGAEIEVEQGLGSALNYADRDYESAGAKISKDRSAVPGRSRHAAAAAEAASQTRLTLLKKGCIHASFLNPFNERELVLRLAAAEVTAVSMEMIPRTTVAQKMDVLSSQANLAGYVAVILAATAINRIFPMLMTPAGTIKPLRVFVIGVGVAGLQAIATARRLGASVEAFDTRPVVEDQVKSLGAKFVKADLGETGETAGGYAKPLTPEQLQKQREVMAQHVGAGGRGHHGRAGFWKKSACHCYDSDGHANETGKRSCRHGNRNRRQCGMCEVRRGDRDRRCENHRVHQFAGPRSGQRQRDVLEQLGCVRRTFLG